MQKVNTYDKILEMLQKHKLLVLYFTGSACEACEVIKEKVEQILEKYPGVQGIEVNGAKYLELATAYEVYTLPIMILFVEGKESLRLGRNLDLLELERKIVRYEEILSLQ